MNSVQESLLYWFESARSQSLKEWESDWLSQPCIWHEITPCQCVNNKNNVQQWLLRVFPVTLTLTQNRQIDCSGQTARSKTQMMGKYIPVLVQIHQSLLATTRHWQESRSVFMHHRKRHADVHFCVENWWTGSRHDLVISTFLWEAISSERWPPTTIWISSI